MHCWADLERFECWGSLSPRGPAPETFAPFLRAHRSEIKQARCWTVIHPWNAEWELVKVWGLHPRSVSTVCSRAGLLCWRCPLRFPASGLLVCLLQESPAAVAETERAVMPFAGMNQAPVGVILTQRWNWALTSIFSGPCIFSWAAKAFLKGVGVLGVAVVTVLRNVGVRDLTRWQRKNEVVYKLL